MREIVLILLLALLGIIPLCGQETPFSEEAETIANRIDSITLVERNEMVKKIQQIDNRLESGVITAKEAKAQREEIADEYAERIETKINKEKEKLDELIANRVDKNIYNDGTEEDNNGWNININRNKENLGERRTTSQFVFAFGVNNLTGNDPEFNDQLSVWRSKFWEFGLTRNTRLSNNSNLFHLKYGLSLLYNNLGPEDNKVFTKDGNKTILTDTNIDFKRNRFRNFYLNIPVHLEFDLSPTKTNSEGNKVFNSHKSARLGLGGYAGVLINSKNFLKYSENGHKVKYSIKDSYNVNDFNYGLSAYVGYKQFTFYTKYDLQSLFKHNDVESRNLSFGLRWDLN